MSMHRVLRPELMDDPRLDPAAHARALRGLARINRWSRSAAIVFPLIATIARSRPGPVRMLDVATGSGDVPVTLCAQAARAGIDLRVDACDVSSTALDAAHARARAAGITITAHRVDCTTEPLPTGFDLAVSSLFLHHLSESHAITVLASMGRAATTVAVNDLRRCRTGLAIAWAGSRILTRSPVVHTDAVRSVHAAWSDAEMADLAARAGLREIRVRRVWPFRMLMTCTAVSPQVGIASTRPNSPGASGMS